MRFFLILFILPLVAIGQTKNIIVDYNQTAGTIRSFQQVNTGPMAIKYQLPDLNTQFKDVGFDYVRLHDVLRGVDTSSFIRPWDVDHIFPNFSADPTVHSNYNFVDADSQITAILSAGATPFIRLGYSFLSPIKYIAPTDIDKWAQVCKHIVMHYNNGWGNGFNYNFRYIEIWNEPNEDNKWFWTGSTSEFFNLYDITAKTLKIYNPNLIIGGPGTAGVPTSWLNTFLTSCKNNNTPLDFLSWHTYDNPDALNPYAFYYQASKAQQLLNSNGFQNSQHILSEWSSVLKASPLSYNAKGAAYTASALIYLQNSTTLMAFRYKANTEDSTGRKLGLWYPDGTWKKPAYTYLAFKKLLLTPIRISSTGSDTLGYTTIAGKSVSGDTVSVIISDFNSLNTNYFLNINNLPKDSFIVYSYVLDSLNNLALTEKSTLWGGNFTLQSNIKSPSVHLIQLVRKNFLTSTNTMFLSEKNNMPIYPNPFESHTIIQFSQFILNGELNIYSMSGEKVRIISNISGNEYNLDRGNLVNGQYLLQLKEGTKMFSGKIVITN